MTELELLATEPLCEPIDLRTFIFDKTDYRTRNTVKVPRFVEFIEMWNGKLLKRTFGFISSSSDKTFKSMLVREVSRELEGYNACLLRDVYHSYMSGHRVEFDGRYQREKFDIHKGKKWVFTAWYGYDREKLIKELDIPYCQYFSKENKSTLDFFDYICLYRKEPKIELLVKAGYSQYLTGLRYLNLKQKSLEKIFKVDKKWVPYLKDMSVSQLLLARKYKFADTLSDLELIENLKYSPNIKKNLSRKMLDYLFKTEGVCGYFSFYNDYLRFAEELGMNMQDNKVLFPKNVRKEHNRLFKQIEISKSEERDREIKAVAEKHKKYIFNDLGFVIFPVTSTEELLEESKELNHCVRTYSDKVANGETEIMFVRLENEPKKPLYTLELQGRKVIQFRAKNNRVPSKEAIAFIQKWSEKNNLECVL